MLKPLLALRLHNVRCAAAFGRLCVETLFYHHVLRRILAAAFGRLCVETLAVVSLYFKCAAAAFGRLCVETKIRMTSDGGFIGSRLRAAVC